MGLGKLEALIRRDTRMMPRRRTFWANVGATPMQPGLVLDHRFAADACRNALFHLEFHSREEKLLPTGTVCGHSLRFASFKMQAR